MNDRTSPDDDPEKEIETVTSDVDAATTPEHVGPYRILQKLGEGGMGEVYQAEQHEPVRRTVALKLIKAGMDTRQVIARFRTEEQALALMNHPTIARVLDAGTTDRGRPYFVMEYVRGVSIDRYCNQHRLSTVERLELFLQVCEGVQHAHQKGIIHRDLKPSNVMVTVQDDKAIPKIIDFGVAKATDRRLTEESLFTEFGQLIGTPEYMSPEQAEMSGLDIDIRTDVYSLGALLYQLLVGRLPFERRELMQSGLDDARRKIREVEPPRPSTRVSTLTGEASAEAADQRRTDQGALMRELRGDLDWITMKALEKDRTRRYASASELAADIRRYLADEPVVASPPSTTYRLRKFIRRHRTAAAAASLVLLAMIVGTAVATVGWVRALRAESLSRAAALRANQEAEAARQISEFLVGLFAVSDPSEARGNEITAREILDKGAMRIEEELQDQPRIKARLMGTMGSVYESLGLYTESRPLAEEALRLRREVLGPDHPDVATSLNALAGLLVIEGNYAEARRHYEEALSIREKEYGPDHPAVASSLNNLANLVSVTGDNRSARKLYERALAIREKTYGAEHPRVASGLNNLAEVFRAIGEYERAQLYYERAIRILEKTVGPDDRTLALTLNNLAILLADRGAYHEARLHHERALAIREKLLGHEHHDVASTLATLALLHVREDEFAEAERLHRRAMDIFEKTVGLDRPFVLYLDASYNAMAGRKQAALAALRRAVIDHTHLGFEELITDRNLASLHDEPEFEAIVAAVRARGTD